MHTTTIPLPDQAHLVDSARLAIWRLFQEGYIDEDMATAGLQAIELGMRRTRQTSVPTVQGHSASVKRKRPLKPRTQAA
jgi:hypothetical protein